LAIPAVEGIVPLAAVFAQPVYVAHFDRDLAMGEVIAGADGFPAAPLSGAWARLELHSHRLG
jgi:hypothetical protein